MSTDENKSKKVSVTDGAPTPTKLIKKGAPTATKPKPKPSDK